MCGTRQNFLNMPLPAMLPNSVDQVSLAFGAIVTEQRIAVSLMAHDWAGRLKLTEPDRDPPSRHCLTYAAVTLLLLAAVAVTGALASHSRDAWWQKYLNLIVKS